MQDKTFPAWMSGLCLLTAMYLTEKLGEKHILGMISAAKGGSNIEMWLPPEALSQCQANKNKQDSSMWKGNVHPFLRHGIKGVFWYQGVSKKPLHLF